MESALAAFYEPDICEPAAGKSHQVISAGHHFPEPFPGVNGQSGVSPNPQIYLFQRDFKNAVTQEWNLTLERQWKQDLLTRASYVGSQAHHLPRNSVERKSADKNWRRIA